MGESLICGLEKTRKGLSTQTQLALAVDVVSLRDVGLELYLVHF
jgi:hypothetical protein